MQQSESVLIPLQEAALGRKKSRGGARRLEPLPLELDDSGESGKEEGEEEEEEEEEAGSRRVRKKAARMTAEEGEPSGDE